MIRHQRKRSQKEKDIRSMAGIPMSYVVRIRSLTLRVEKSKERQLFMENGKLMDLLLETNTQ